MGGFHAYHLRHTIYLLCFQEHSRFQRLTTFVFYNIPASPPLFPQRSFVFMDIPALLRHFLESLGFLLSPPV
jgi:hypothetical protein